MSTRYEIYKGNKGLAFGNDHACGEFLQIWDTSDHTQPDTDNILVDEDTQLTGLTRTRMIDLLEQHGFTEEDLAIAYNRKESL